MQDHEPFLGVAWSLCYEVFFYLVFGLAILLGRKVLLLYVITYIGLLLNFYLHIIELPIKGLFILMSSNYNIDFLIGIASAFIYKKSLSSSSNLTGHINFKFILSLGTAFFLLSWYFTLSNPDYFGKQEIYSRIVYGLSSGMILYCIAHMPNPGKGRGISFLLLLGNASYVLYLVHPLTLAINYKMGNKFFQTVNMSTAYVLAIFTLLCCVLVGIMIHMFIEVKILNFLTKNLVKPKFIFRQS